MAAVLALSCKLANKTEHMLLFMPGAQESLFDQLQQLPPLSSVPPSAQPSHFVLPSSGSARSAAARQAHALMLAEARVGARWWAPLKLLNRQEAKRATPLPAGCTPDDWEEQDQVWRQQWEVLARAERGRPDVLAQRARAGAARA